MQTEEYTYLIYDKASRSTNWDHTYTNKFTKDITVDKLFGSNIEYYENEKAISEYNKFGKEYEIEKIDFDFYNSCLFHWIDNGISIKILLIGINNKKLEKYVIENITIPNKDFLISLCKFNNLYTKSSNGTNLDIFNKSKIELLKNDISVKIAKNAMESNADQTDPILNVPSFSKIPLYDYQKRTIKWMKNHEEINDILYYNNNDVTLIGNVIYDTFKHAFSLAKSRDTLLINGGGLIDEVGLGKTYQMITLALSNQAKKINYIQNKYNKLFSRATLIICPNQLGGQWVREFKKVIKDDYKLNIINIFTKTHHDKYTYQDLLDADFVIVSYNFLDNKCFLNQWVNELDSNKTYIVSDKFNYDFETSKEVKKIVDGLGNKLKNKITSIVEKQPNLLLIHWHRISIDEAHEPFTVPKYKYMQKILNLFDANYKWVMTATPFDKGEGCIVNLLDFVSNYQNKSGNNILLNNSVSEYMLKRFFRRNTKKSVVSEYSLPPLKETVVKLRFSKTEWMMYNAYIMNPSVDKFGVLLRQICCHPKLAEEMKTVLSNCKTLDDVESMMVKHYKSQMDQSHNKVKYMDYRIKKIELKIKINEWKRQRKFLKQKGYKVKILYEDNLNKKEFRELEEKLRYDPEFTGIIGQNDNDDNPFGDESTTDDEDDREIIIISDSTQKKVMDIVGKQMVKEQSQVLIQLQDTKLNFLTKLNVLAKDYDGKKRTYDYYNEVMNKLKKISVKITDESDSENEDENIKCTVCLGNITGNDLGFTKCGHLFCYNCVKPFIEKQRKCPMCQKPVNTNEIYMIEKPIPEDKKDKEFEDKQELIGKVGTKLGNLIFFIKKNNLKHFIIFSQWDDLLKKVGDVFNDYGITNVFCKGNIWQRDKAIREFNDNKNIKVIMLSSESAASGTNLTKADMVILLDPVYGTYEYRRNTEWQAIGRAYRMGQTKEVEVVRFIIENTVEEEIYNMNKSEDDKLNVSNKIVEFTGDTINLEKDKIEEIVNAVKESEKIKSVKKIAKK